MSFTFDREHCEMIEAMGLGPVWLLRESPDPLAPSVPHVPKPAPAAAPAPRAARPGAPAAAPRQPERTAPAARRPVAAPEAKPAPAEAPAPVMPESMIEEIRTADWAKLKELALSCRSCRLCERRSKVVFSEGEPGPKLVIVGEAPGAEEDLQGVPFVGKAGKLLTAMLESLNITRRKDVVILNVLKCRPPNNRDPEPGEIVCCGRYLRRQLEILAPEVILLTGRFSARTVLGLEETMSIGRMRGRVHEARVGDRTIPAVVTYHPSYLLRSPGEKAKSWEDLLLLRDVMEKAGILPPPREKRWT